MFRNLRAWRVAPAEGRRLGGDWRTKAIYVATSLLLLTAGSISAEPATSTWRPDSSNFQSEQDSLPPDRPPQPPIEINDNPSGPPAPGGFQEGPNSDDPAPPAPRRHRSHREREREFDGEGPSPALLPSLPPSLPPSPPRHRMRHQEQDRPAIRHDDQLPEPELIRRKLTNRYGNPAIVRLVRSWSPQQSLEVYQEISGLIDARHLKPSPYDARVKQAVKNLTLALDNPVFLQANGLGQDSSRLDAFRVDLQRVADGQPVRNADDAFQALQWTMQAADRDAGLRPTVVVMEFIFGATDSLDKYSAFVPAIGRGAPSAELEDHIVGIGVEIKADERGMLISKALPGGPAAQAGLQSGDMIESIDGHKVTGASIDSAVDLITGPSGSQITLGVRRDERLAEVKLVRRRVEVHSVSEVKMLDDSVGYIKLEKFAQNSSEEIDKALWDLYRQGMKSLVIDVRGNPGGLLTTAIQLSNKFIPAGTIVSTRGRDASDDMVEYAHRDRTWKTPLVVLVDENSASASEIFAAAVQENSRGKIVGCRTYGKGTVQTHFPLQTVQGTLRLTTAKFYSPNGREMAGAGVEPDVHVTAELAGERAYYEQGGPDRHDVGYDHELYGQRDGARHHEAAYRHGGSSRRDASQGTDRALSAAIETAVSPEVAEMARSAGNRPGTGRPSDR
jgi:carboxyl-terminal processing protease